MIITLFSNENNIYLKWTCVCVLMNIRYHNDDSKVYHDNETNLTAYFMTSNGKTRKKRKRDQKFAGRSRMTFDEIVLSICQKH